jgi:hypothetical protein
MSRGREPVARGGGRTLLTGALAQAPERSKGLGVQCFGVEVW